MLKRLKSELTSLIKEAVYKNLPLLKKKPLNIHLEIPKDKEHGNLSTNIALQISSILKKDPLDTASLIREDLLKLINKGKLKEKISEVEVKSPGFLNFIFNNDFSYKILKIISNNPNRIIRERPKRVNKVQIEFVSANPTGPLSIAHGRQAAVGDTLANILEARGNNVTREYFINDEGNQIDALGKSVMVRYLELHNKKTSLPEDGYHGDYIVDIAREVDKKFNKKFMDDKRFNSLKVVSSFSVKKILDEIKDDLESFGVHMNVWFSQKKLSKDNSIDKIIKAFLNKGLVYEKEGALWFKSTQFGDDKDRVVIKSSGEYTYLAPDIAYHKDKYKRGFKNVINIWGPDHHGYIPRLKAAVMALGYPEEFLTILIIQLATLYKKGKPVSMSTRKGEYVTLKQLIDEVGKDAARFFFLMRKRNSHLNFDLELAKKKSADNPVYYIQYAHARISSIIELSKENKKRLPKCDYSLLKSEEELNLIKALIEFPNILEAITLSLEPHFLTVYLRKLAESFHVFYQRYRILNDDPSLTSVRLNLIKAVKNILHEGLSLLGVSSPAKM